MPQIKERTKPTGTATATVRVRKLSSTKVAARELRVLVQCVCFLPLAQQPP